MKKIERSDKEWRKLLSPQQYSVCRLGNTEPPFSGRYLTNSSSGTYACTACGLDLFHAEAKFDSKTGWPSFFRPLASDRIAEVEDNSHGMRRTEIRCARCESHLGHVFGDGPAPTGLRFCVNSVALEFRPDS